jgi:uncharacterized protein (TIGR00251 family)
MESVTQNADGSFTVKVHAPPVEGKANKRVIELLAEHFGKSKSSILLLHGSSGKKKIFEIG